MLLTFKDPQASNHELVGGKGANLGLLTQAGFKVPPGFTVTTEAYTAFLESSELRPLIREALAHLDPQDLPMLEKQAARVRSAITGATVPASVVKLINAAYASLGVSVYVAVRSSGTAEDLSGASFAGLHDTYLDTRGENDLLTAIRACWASLYTARALAYRINKKFDEANVRMAVVVQQMIESDVSGVMFTGNPLTASTTEIVVNASWGLGEAVVQGIVVPDQYVLAYSDLRAKEKIAGNKKLKIVRDSATGSGVVTIPVVADAQKAFALTDAQLGALGALGKRISAHYDEIPQDIEWGIAQNEIYLFQSRPITGVEFSWDSDVDQFQTLRDDDDIIWSRVYADELWTGAISPLMFSWRGERWVLNFLGTGIPIVQKPELSKHKYIRYYKGTSYTNIRHEEIMMSTAPPPSRLGMALKLPPERREAALKQPFSYWDYLQSVARAVLLNPDTGGPYQWMRVVQHYIDNRVADAEGLWGEGLEALTDAELKKYVAKQIGFENDYNNSQIWPGFCLYFRDSMSLLTVMLSNWYDGSNANVLAELLSGSDVTSATTKEHIELYDISRLIRNSELLAAFNSIGGVEFFAHALRHPAGQEIADRVDAFLRSSGHRGHSDRDIYFPRYLDDSGILYRALAVYLKSDEDPRVRERDNRQRRLAALVGVEENLKYKPFGPLKFEAIKVALAYVSSCILYRDNERQFIDRNTYSIRRAFLEVNRRIRARGLLSSDRDFWFLGQEELFAVLDGTYNRKLTAAKIAARMQNFDRVNRKEWAPPKFLQGDLPLESADASSLSADGQVLLKGLPTSKGVTTGIARVVKTLEEIGRVNKGEILVANSTDPGWTPVFAVISGVVVETGGLLSHSSCLAREYGFPAAQIEEAVQRIPDGATITVNGNAGSVVIHKSTQLATP